MRQDPDFGFSTARPELDPAMVKKAVRTGGCLLAIVLVSVVVLALVVPYTEFLWFKHDARAPQVFTRGYGIRSTLLLVSFLAGWGMLYFNLRKALNQSLVYLRTPESRGQILISHALTWVQTRGSDAVRFGAPILAFLSALGFANEWNTFLLARHGVPFQQRDPIFGLDLSFFVFDLPWYRAIANYVFALLFITTAAAVAVYVGLQAMAALARIELNRPQIRLHLSVLLGLTAVAYGAQLYLRSYEAGLMDSGQFTGAGYAGMQQVLLLRILAILCAVSGVLVAVLYRRGQPFRLAMILGIGLAAFYGLVLVVYPELVQRGYVAPNRLRVEAPFAMRAIKMTRWAYGLDRITVRDGAMQPLPTQTEIASSSVTLSNMRLWDPDVLRTALDTLQGIRPYYAFNDVDIDRYQIDGKQTILMVAARDIELAGLAASAQDWTNQRLRYTHGYGVTISRVDAATNEGLPAFLAKDIPMSSVPDLRVDEPRIYFSDSRDAANRPRDEYALVHSGVDELDYPTTTGSSTHRWGGDRGIPIGGFFTKLLYGIRFRDGNLLISPNIRAESRLLMHRHVLNRASKMYPFLMFDNDPYIVVSNGRLIWILDGYTWTDSMPFSARIGAGGKSLNYIRNSVKVTIDAYNGETMAYAMENEPILETYRRIYPGLVKDGTALPAGLRPHLRYPEDQLWLQSVLLTVYHVIDPVVFLSNSDAWDIARERNLQGSQDTVKPYYVQMQLPGETAAGFFQILPFTPRDKPNMSAWLAAHCDPGSYGRLTLYRFTGNEPVPGPETIEANFSSTPEISFINRQYNNEQSSVIVGNLLAIPLGKSILFSEALFLQSKTGGIRAVPRLFRVALAIGDRVAVGETYAAALDKLLGFEAAPEPEPGPGPGQAPPPSGAGPSKEAVRRALTLLDRAEQALRQGEFARYGELQKQAREALRNLLAR